MKTNLLMIIVVAFLLNACNVGVNKDLLSGLKVTNNGLSYSEASLIMDSAKLTNNEFPVGKTIFLHVSGVNGFKLKNGKVYLGASLAIIDEKGNKIMDELDLFKAYDQEGVQEDQSKGITLQLKVGTPMQSGSKYTWKSKIWDKNGTGTIETESKFVVK